MRSLVVGMVFVAFMLSGCEKAKEALQGSSLGGNEKYILAKKNPERKMGWTMVTKTESQGLDLKVTLNSGGRVVEGSADRKLSKQHVSQVLGPNRLRLTVQRDQINESYRVAGLPKNPTYPKGVLVGKYVILEKARETWNASFESGEKPSKEEETALLDVTSGMDDDAQIYGFEPRKIGEQWTVKLNEPELGRSSTYQLLFESVEEFRGEQCAVLTFKEEMKVNRSNSGVAEETTIVGEGKIYRSLEHHVDLSSEFAGDITTAISPSLGTTVKLSGLFALITNNEVTLPPKKDEA